ncbi:MAG: NUDIX domain-containing protein [Candidatus Gracilibacteria bacterium]|jgi:isopentenyldiphosphate isomerase
MAEYFDILDENGKQTGKTKLRAEVHRDGDWHKSVDIWIINPKDEVLIQKRSAQKESYPGLWEVSCSGHVNSGESSLDSAIRELMEELGVSVPKEKLQFLFEDKETNITNNGTFINNEFKEVYLLELDLEIEDYHVQKEEVETVKYINSTELENSIKQNPKEFVSHDMLYEKFFAFLKAKRIK